MPGMAGLELQKLLLASNFSLPTVFHFAHCDSEAQARASRALRVTSGRIEASG